MSDFGSPEELLNKLKELLDRMQFEYDDDNQNPDLFHFVIRQIIDEDDPIRIGVSLVYRKDIEYRLEVVSNVNFSPDHIQILQDSSKNEIGSMMYEINLFTLPRESEVFIDLNEENQFINSYYSVNNPIYENELSIAVLEKRMLRSLNVAQLLRLLIQKHLNK